MGREGGRGREGWRAGEKLSFRDTRPLIIPALELTRLSCLNKDTDIIKY